MTPTMGAELAQPVAEIYQEAELRILRRITAALSEGIDGLGWEELQLARLQQVRREVVAELEAHNPAAAREILLAIDQAYSDGQASAYSDVGDRLDPVDAIPQNRVAAVRALAADTAANMLEAQDGILRAVDDTYRSTVARATQSVLAGAEGRREATQRVLSELTAQGLTFKDSRNRTWDLANYSTMAVRTATSRSSLAGHLDTMADYGLDLVIIHPGPRACKICDEWARKILARSGAAGVQQLQSIKAGKRVMVAVTVDDTLAAARAAGWGHPNCRCGLAAYLPGVTKADAIERPPWDEEGYKAQQQQRGIEREIRGWKQREATALTESGKSLAKRNVAASQERMREHLKRHPDLKRQGKREQLGPNGGGRAQLVDRTKAPTKPGPERELPTPTTKNTPALRRPREDAPTRQELPKSTTPKLDALPRRKNDGPAELGANPLYTTNDPRYTNNCTHVSAAVELRARGYDVQATGIPTGTGQAGYKVFDRMFRRADGSKVPLSEFQQLTVRQAKAKAMEWPEGARGTLVVQWKGSSSGHIANLVKRDGKLVILEGQTNDGTVRDYWAQARNASVQRTDDLVLTDDWEDFARPAMTPEERREAVGATGQAQRRREAEERRDLEQRLRPKIRKLERDQAALMARIMEAINNGKGAEAVFLNEGWQREQRKLEKLKKQLGE